MKEEWEKQQSRITALSKNLRYQYYHQNDGLNCYFETPAGIDGHLEESIGEWPEFIFKGTFCARTFLGYCSPCFYSQFPAHNKQMGRDYQDMIRKQFNHVIENFKELVINRQVGKRDPKEVSFVLTPTGSFFDNIEFPQPLRIEMLHGLINAGKIHNVVINLLIECHCKDWNALDLSTRASQEELFLLRKLNAKLLFGFESVAEYTREVLYNKHLTLEEFEQAYDSVKENGLSAGVFIFAGLFSMNDRDTITDVCNSIDYALEKNLTPVIMFQNVQPNTISALLFQAGKISLLEPFTVLKITKYLILKAGKYPKANWLIADPKGGPPAPVFNIFDCARITSKENSNLIYQAICNLRLSKNTQEFLDREAAITNTDNYLKYELYLNQHIDEDIEERTNCLLDDAERLYANLYGGDIK